MSTINSSSLSIGLSALNAFQTAGAVSANNIANANTDGFKPAQTQFSEASPAGSGVFATPVQPSQSSSASQSNTGEDDPSRTNVADELVNQQIYKVGFQASAKVIKTSNEMLGSLLDVRG